MQEEHADVLQRLNNGEIKGLLFKKLKTRHPLLNGIYSVRDKKEKYKDRLLVRIIEIDGKPHPLVLEKVTKHKHARALYLNDTAGTVGRYQKLLDSIEDIDFMKDDGAAFIPETTSASQIPPNSVILLYVAEQEKLVNEFRTQYNEHPLSQVKSGRVNIKFMTIKDFSRKNLISETLFTIVETKYFLQWFSNYREKLGDYRGTRFF